MANSDPLWIEHMHLKKGALRRSTHTKKGQNISTKAMESSLHSKSSTTKKRAVVAQTLAKYHK